MGNLLGYECPICTSSDEIDVAATLWLRLTENGTDANHADNHDHEYHNRSTAICQACGFQGKLGEFDPPKPAFDVLETLQQALSALNTAPCFRVPSLDSDSYKIAARCEAAIKALGREG